MARLGQIIKTLNIGIGTAVDFLNKKGENIEELLDFIVFLSNNTLNNHKVYMSYFMQARFQFERGASNIVYHNLKHVKSCSKGIKEVMEKSKKIIV